MFLSNLSPYFPDEMKQHADQLISSKKCKVYLDNDREIRSLTFDLPLAEAKSQITKKNNSNMLIGRCDCDNFKAHRPCSHLWALLLQTGNSVFSQKITGTDVKWIFDFTPIETPVELVPQQDEKNPKLRELELILKRQKRQKFQEDSVASIEKRKFGPMWFGVDLSAPGSSPQRCELPLFCYEENIKKTGLQNFRPLSLTPESIGLFRSFSEKENATLLQQMVPATLSPYWRQRLQRHKRSVAFLPKEVLRFTLERLSATDKLFLIDSKMELGLLKKIKFSAQEKAQLKLEIKELDHQSISIEAKILYRKKTYEIDKFHLNLDLNLAVVENSLVPLVTHQLNTVTDYLLQEKQLIVQKIDVPQLRNLVVDYLPLESMEHAELLGLETKTLDGQLLVNLSFEWTPEGPLIFGEMSVQYPHAPQPWKIHDAQTWASFSRETYRYLRNQDLEDKWLEELNQLDGIKILDPESPHNIIIEAAHFFDVCSTFDHLNAIVTSQKARLYTPKNFSNTLKANNDWFELKAKVEFETESENKKQSFMLPEILQQSVAKGQIPGAFLQLGDGKIGLLPEAWLQKQLALAQISEQQDDSLMIHSSQALGLELLLEKERDQLEHISWGELKERASQKEFQQVNVPTTFKAQLRPYQKVGLQWMLFLKQIGMGGCLADEMGLGKTLQVLCFFETCRIEALKDGRKAPIQLVVVPKSLLFNWASEAKKFAPALNIIILDQNPEQRSQIVKECFASVQDAVIICSYGVMRQDALSLKEYQFETVVLDEAQAIKNPDSQTAKLACLLKAKLRIAMSGTPVENSLYDLFSLFRFLWPHLTHQRLQRSHFDFANPPLMRKILQSMSPFILRRKKSDVLTELPEKIEAVHYCEMEPEQLKVYNELKSYYQGQFQSSGQGDTQSPNRMKALEALLRLRQAAADPGLIDPFYKGRSGKVETLIQHLLEIQENGHKALVFSQFTSLLKRVEVRLKDEKIDYCYLDGQTQNRQKVVQEFKEGASKTVFLLSLKAGGVGLNLTEANYAFILDPWWNPAIEAQAFDRIHRIGQNRSVFTYRMISRGSVEEKVLALQKDKVLLADQLMTSDEVSAHDAVELLQFLMN